MQMMFTFEDASYHDIKRSVFISTKVSVGLLILIYFGENFVNCNEDIPFCDQQLKQLKKDINDWNQKCWSNQNQGEGTPPCLTEKKYNQDRMKIHVEMCFYAGKGFIMRIKLGVGAFYHELTFPV